MVRICECESIIVNSAVYQWQVNGQDIGTNSNTYITSDLSDNAEIRCVVRSLVNNCSVNGTSSNVISIKINPLPVVFIIPQDTTVVAGSQVQLTALINGNIASYEWLPASGLINSTVAAPVTVPINEKMEYSLNVKSEDGCAANKKVTIHVYNKLLIPNAFTPNRDGINDVFRIPGNTGLKLKEFFCSQQVGAKSIFYNRYNQRLEWG